jgi:CTP:molybdopterin cytidylyltransferase MocA
MEGESKLLAGFGGVPVLGRVISGARSAGLEPIFVVVADPDPGVRRALAGEPVRFVRVEPGENGRLASVVAGLEAVRSASAAGVAILLGDEPGLRAEHVRTVIRTIRSGPEVVGRPRYRDRPGHPVVLKAEAIEEVRDLARNASAEVRLWDLIVRSTLTHRSVLVADESPIDVDTRADLARARQRDGLERLDGREDEARGEPLTGAGG